MVKPPQAIECTDRKLYERLIDFLNNLVKEQPSFFTGKKRFIMPVTKDDVRCQIIVQICSEDECGKKGEKEAIEWVLAALKKEFGSILVKQGLIIDPKPGKITYKVDVDADMIILYTAVVQAD